MADENVAQVSPLVRAALALVAVASIICLFLHALKLGSFDHTSAMFLAIAVLALIVDQVTKFKGFGVEFEKAVSAVKNEAKQEIRETKSEVRDEVAGVILQVKEDLASVRNGAKLEVAEAVKLLKEELAEARKASKDAALEATRQFREEIGESKRDARAQVAEIVRLAREDVANASLHATKQAEAAVNKTMQTVQELDVAIGQVQKRFSPKEQQALQARNRARRAGVPHVDSWDSDPNADKFGKTPEKDGRALRAKIKQTSPKSAKCYVTLWVESTDPASPLKEPVKLYLHPTYGDEAEYELSVQNGVARDDEPIEAWGVFTVGAEVIGSSGKRVKLGLDLANVSGGSDRFYEN